MKTNLEWMTFEELDTMPYSNPDTGDRLVLQEYGIAIRSALGQLLPKEAAIIRKRYLNGHLENETSYRRLAQKMQCSHETVRKLELSGLEKLKESLLSSSDLFTEFIETRIPPRIQPKQPVRTARHANTDRSRMTPAQKKKHDLQLKKDWYYQNRERRLRRNKELYYENKEWVYHIANKWIKKNRFRHLQYQNLYHRAGRKILADWYVRGQLTTANLSAKDIPAELVKVKKRAMELNRLIKYKHKDKEG